MAQDPESPADGHERRILSSGDLIHASDGTSLIVLGVPRSDETVGHLLDGTLVVLGPNGKPALYLPLAPIRSRLPVLVPWDLGWEPINDYDPVSAVSSGRDLMLSHQPPLRAYGIRMNPTGSHK